MTEIINHMDWYMQYTQQNQQLSKPVLLCILNCFENHAGSRSVTMIKASTLPIVSKKYVKSFEKQFFITYMSA